MRSYLASIVMLAAIFTCLSHVHAEPVTIVEDGQPAATIVLADQSASDALKRVVPPKRHRMTLQDAAEFLRDTIKQVSGAELPIVPESEMPETGTLILVGETQLGRSLGITVDDLADEGYRVKSIPRGVAIVGHLHENGTDFSTLFGVYDFLERVAGVRWYFPGEIGTIIPERDTLSVPELDITNRPHFEVRVGAVGYWQVEQARKWYPALRYGYRDGKPANHTHEDWVERFGESNPEYFGVREDGTRAITTRRARSGQSQAHVCYAEPGVLDQHMADATAWLENGDTSGFKRSVKPSGNIIPFGPSDTREVCVCEDCRKLIDRSRGRHGFSSDLIFDFVVRFAERLKERHPDAILSVLAYDHYQLPPTNIDRLPDNVMVTICLLPSVIHMPQPEIRAELRGRIDKWSELVGGRRDRLIIWDYYVYPNYWFVAPTEMPHVLQDHVRYLDDKALGIFNNGFSLMRQDNKFTANRILTYRMVWLMHKLLWNPDLDLEQARYDWCHDLFGPAGDEMVELYKLLEDRWQNVAWDHQSTTAIHISEHLIYEQTYPREVVDKIKARLARAQQVVASSDDADAQRRLTWFTEEAFQPFFEEAAQFHAVGGRIPQHQVTQAETAPAIDGVLDEDAWKTASPQTLAKSIDGTPADERTGVMIASDVDALYVAARMAVSDLDALKGEANTVTPEDDKFIIHLRPTDEPGHLELIVNPTGAASTTANPMKKYGIFPTHPVRNWDGDGVEAAARVEENTWTVEVKIPWASMPGIEGAPPRLRAQFLRWASTSKYAFDSWSATMSTWDYPDSRYGHLLIDDTPTNRVDLLPAVGGAVYLGAMGPETEQPTDVGAMRVDREFLIVGQRDLMGDKWLEMRTLLRFDLTDLPDDPQAISRATLSLHHFNAVESEPFDNVVVDHIAGTDTSTIQEDDYHVDSLRENVGTLLSSTQVGERRMYTLDVSEYVRADIADGRTTSTFRLRIPDGPTELDEKTHFIMFRGISQQHSNQIPQLAVDVYEQSDED